MRKTSNNLKLLNGTAQPCRMSKNPVEVTAVESLDPPDDLDGIALLTWERVVPLLTAARVLTDADRIAVEQYCQTYANWREAAQAVARDGVTVENGKGLPVKHPAWAIQKETSAELRALSSMLGLDPASRARVETLPAPKTEKPGFGDRRSPKTEDERWDEFRS